MLNFRKINGQYTGLLAEVVYGRADVSFNGRFLNDPLDDKTYRYTKTNGRDYICFVVPRAEDLSRMQILFSTFTPEVWLCVVVTYALMAKSVQLFNKFKLPGGWKIYNPSMTSLQVNGLTKFCHDLSNRLQIYLICFFFI